jgi:hypothetical protein
MCVRAFVTVVFCLPKLYLTGAVYSLDGSDSLKETMQTNIASDNKVRLMISQPPQSTLPIKHISSSRVSLLRAYLFGLFKPSFLCGRWKSEWMSGSSVLA